MTSTISLILWIPLAAGWEQNFQHTELLREAFKDVTQRKVLHKQSIGIHWTIMAAKAGLAFRSQNYPTSYRMSNISAEWELEAAKRCTVPATMAFAKPITILTHTQGQEQGQTFTLLF